MKSSTFLAASILFVPNQLFACINCNKEITQAIFNSTFYPNLFAILSPFVVLAILVAVISGISLKAHHAKIKHFPHQKGLSSVPLMAASTVLGIGLGGFVDGIVLHQLLQWHEMISNKISPTNYINKSVNMFWDGIFHAFAFLVTLTGVILLWKISRRKDINRSGNLLAGGMVFGWGLFNLLEGLADHQVLKLHNVREVATNKEAWNFGFLALSIILIIAGLLIAKRKKEDDGSFLLL